MLNRKETLSSLTWEMLVRKNIKKHKRLVLRSEALYLVINIFCLYQICPIPKLCPILLSNTKTLIKKKSHFQSFRFLKVLPDLKPRKYSAGKYVWHCFWKGERSWWDSKQHECRCNRPKGSIKKVRWKFF